MDLGNIIFSLRKEHSLTQEAFANALNKKYGLKLNKAMISKWENNIDTPSLNYVKYMAIFFNVSLDYMLGTFPSSSTSALPEQDRMLLENFHRLSDSQQARLLAYLDGLLDAGRDVKGKDAGGSELTDLLYYDYKPASGMVAEPIAEYNCGRKTQAKKSAGEPVTIAAHHDSEDWTEEELAEIEKFKKYVKTERE